MFGLGKLIYVIILTVNGIAVLSEDRFLNRIGWSTSSLNSNSNSNNAANSYQLQFINAQNNSDNYSIKNRLITLIGAIRTLLRVPLIIINVVIILYEILLG